MLLIGLALAAVLAVYPVAGAAISERVVIE
jgi:hypothetical protein